MRLLVDMDGVLASWGGEYDRHLDAWGAPATNIPRTHDPRNANWDLHAGRTPNEVTIIRNIMRAPGFYADLEEIDGGIVAMRNALASGIDVRIVTSPYVSNYSCASDKFQWVGRHLGQKWLSRVVMTADKTLVSGDALVDDKPSVTGAVERPEWEHVIFGNYPYNAHPVIDFEDRRSRIHEWAPDTLLALASRIEYRRDIRRSPSPSFAPDPTPHIGALS